MFPEDRVLVGVVKARRDLKHARDQHWYRIPQNKMPNGIDTDYVAFFLSGKVFKEQSGGIHYYAPVTGYELVRRRDLLPAQSGHPRADEVYYKIALGELEVKQPPILNPTKRVISFIYTTWDRFVVAKTIPELYSPADYFVDRIFHALRERGQSSREKWAAHRVYSADPDAYNKAPLLRIMWDGGAVNASTGEGDGLFFLDQAIEEDEILRKLIDEIKSQGGPQFIHIPADI